MDLGMINQDNINLWSMKHVQFFFYLMYFIKGDQNQEPY